MPTVQGIYEENRHLFSTVPSISEEFVCRFCLGPVAPEFGQCFACNKLFNMSHLVGNMHLQVPSQLHNTVVPASSVLNPSPYYTWLSTYKGGHPERGPALVCLAVAYIQVNRGRFESLLGGDIDAYTAVPSKRGYSFSDQHFVKTLRRVSSLKDSLAHALSYESGSSLGRHTYNPTAFSPGPDSVSGKRVILLEDAWVTGATAISAAGALLREGAESVAVVPIARVVDGGFWPEDSPYLLRMEEEYAPDWPR